MTRVLLLLLNMATPPGYDLFAAPPGAIHLPLHLYYHTAPWRRYYLYIVHSQNGQNDTDFVNGPHLLHQKGSFPMTPRPDELWILDHTQNGTETWKPLEVFLEELDISHDPFAPQPTVGASSSGSQLLRLVSLLPLIILFYHIQNTPMYTLIDPSQRSRTILPFYKPVGDVQPTIIHKVPLHHCYGHLGVLHHHRHLQVQEIPHL